MQIKLKYENAKLICVCVTWGENFDVAFELPISRLVYTIIYVSDFTLDITRTLGVKMLLYSM